MTPTLRHDVTVSSRDVATFVDAVHVGPEVQLKGFDALDAAGPEEFAYCVYDDPEHLFASDAGAVVCLPSVEKTGDRTVLTAENPKLAFIRAVDEFFRERTRDPSVHETAVIHEEATLGDDVSVGPHVFVDRDVVVGDECTLRAGVAIGSQGFGFERDARGRLHRQFHEGGVRIGRDVEIGPNTSIDRAVFDETVIEQGTKLSGQIHVAHGVHIGAHTTVAYNAGFAGGVTIGSRVTVHPHASVATDVTVGDGAEIGMNATVLEDVPPKTTVVGSPARPIGDGEG